MKRKLNVIEIVSSVVLVIVIALIIIPTIIHQINNNKEASFSAVIDEIVGKIRINMYENGALEQEYTITDGVMSPSIDVSGDMTGNGIIKVNKNGDIFICINSSGYYAYKSYSDAYVSIISGKFDMKKLIINSNNLVSSPILGNNMIPVSYDGVNWVKADIDNPDSDWYDYESGKWANVVTVKNYDKYNNAKVGSTIDMSKVLMFYVWIPIYQYDINEAGIDVNFTNIYTNSGNIPEAFYYNGSLIPGFWVNKFELSQDNKTYKSVPNVSSLRNVNLNDFIKIAANINTDNMPKIDSKITKTNNILESFTNNHVIKNSEWGAISYLADSKYGNSSIMTNKSYVTGNASFDGNNYNYNTENGVKASTTNNIYGVYDMVGSASEMVMGTKNIDHISSNLNKYYYDDYTDKTYLKGDATLEISNHFLNGTWFDGTSGLLSNENNNSIYIRGGNKDNESNIFMYMNSDITGNDTISTRFTANIISVYKR